MFLFLKRLISHLNSEQNFSPMYNCFHFASGPPKSITKGRITDISSRTRENVIPISTNLGRVPFVARPFSFISYSYFDTRNFITFEHLNTSGLSINIFLDGTSVLLI